MDGDLSPRSAEIVELRSQMTAERAEKDNALAVAAELCAAALAIETAVPDPAAPGPSAQQDPTEACIVAAAAAALRGQISSNSSTNRFNAAVAAMGPEKFSHSVTMQGFQKCRDRFTDFQRTSLTAC